MRLIKQCFLYFKEGKSDKVYEIDLCDVGDDKYVVNFRYGRKGANLKEGSSSISVYRELRQSTIANIPAIQTTLLFPTTTMP